MSNEGMWIMEIPGDMTLRDLFAAFALAGMIVAMPTFMGSGKNAAAAETAYEIANAMLAERDRVMDRLADQIRNDGRKDNS